MIVLDGFVYIQWIMKMDGEMDNECGREKAPFGCKRSSFIMQKDPFCTPIVPLLQCKKGFFAHLKLYFGSAKKPFCVIYRVSDAMKTNKIAS